MIVILNACRREIEPFPEDIRSDLADALARLDASLHLSMPRSRPMPNIVVGLKARSGAYRIVYALVAQGEGDSAMIKKRRPSAAGLARQLGIPKRRGVEAVLKAQLIAAVTRQIERRRLTHAEVAARSGLPRTAVTGILSGSLQKVTIDRVLRLLEAVGLEATVRVTRAS